MIARGGRNRSPDKDLDGPGARAAAPGRDRIPDRLQPFHESPAAGPGAAVIIQGSALATPSSTQGLL